MKNYKAELDFVVDLIHKHPSPNMFGYYDRDEDNLLCFVFNPCFSLEFSIFQVNLILSYFIYIYSKEVNSYLQKTREEIKQIIITSYFEVEHGRN